MSQSQQPLLPPRYQSLLNRIMRWLCIFSLFILVVVVLSVLTVRYSINRDCNNPYNRKLHLLGYWINIDAGSDTAGCSAAP